MRSRSACDSPVDVVRRPDQALLLGGPPREPHGVLRRDVGHHQRRLQERRRAGAVVVDSRPLDDAVEMGAGHDDVVVVPALELRDHVEVRPGLGRDHVHERGRARLRQRRAVGEARAHDRDVMGDRTGRPVRDGYHARGVRDDQALAIGRVALVEDDHRLGARQLGVMTPCRRRSRCRAGSARCPRRRSSRYRRNRPPRSRCPTRDRRSG